MFTRIEESAYKTQGFWKYIIQELVNHAPLYKNQVIEFRLVEGFTPLPEFSEILDRSNPNVPTEFEIWDDKKRREDRGSCLNFYIHAKVKGLCYVQGSRTEDGSPLNTTLQLIVSDPGKIYQEAQLLGIAVPDFELFKVGNSSLSPQFDEVSSKIIWGDKIIEIEPNSRHFYICKVAFNKPINNPISWDEIADAEGGIKGKNSFEKRRKVNFAIHQINKKIAAKTGRKLFAWKKLTFTRLT